MTSPFRFWPSDTALIVICVSVIVGAFTYIITSPSATEPLTCDAAQKERVFMRCVDATPTMNDSTVRRCYEAARDIACRPAKQVTP